MLRQRGQRWTLFICSTLLPFVGAAWGIYLRTAGDDLWNWQTLIIPAMILLLSGTIAYRSIIKPFRDFEPIAREFLDHLSKSIIALGTRDGIRPRMNILLVYRPWYWPRRMLRSAWGAEMNNQPDVDISFPATKGVAGEVCIRKVPQLVDLEQTQQSEWGFSEKDIKKYNLQQIKAIYSYPIYEIGRHKRQTGNVIGTVNLDARADGAIRKINARIDTYKKYLELFSEFASKIAS